MSPPPPHLELSNACKRYHSPEDSFELRIPSMRLKRGGVYVVAGRSGCGKTTLLDALGCISQFDYVDEFAISDEDEKIISLKHATGRDLSRIRRRYLGYVLQQGGLLPFLTIKENILLPIQLSRTSKRKKAAALDIAKQLGLSKAHLSRYPSALSIGQRQRVCIARALAHQPELLLADEPTGALDPANAVIVRDLLLKHVRLFGVTAIVVTHDVELFAQHADGIFSFTIEQHEKTTISTLTLED